MAFVLALCLFNSSAFAQATSSDIFEPVLDAQNRLQEYYDAEALEEDNKLSEKRTDEQRKAQSERMKGKEPVKASEAAKEYRKTHKPYWQEHPVTDEMRANMKAAQQKLGTKVIAIYPDGATQVFNTMLDAAKACDMNVGSVSYLANSNGISAKNGMRFQKIT